VGSAGLTLDALAGDLAAVLDHLDTRGSVVAGHSLGGMALQAFAARHPELPSDRIGAAVLVATACSGLAENRRHRVGPRVVGRRRVERLLAHRVLGPLAVRDYVGRRPCLGHLEAITKTFLATPGEVRVKLLEAMLEMDLTGALARLDVPVTVVVGDADRHTTPQQARAIAAAVPGAELVVVPDAGHMLPFEAPDLLARLVAEAAGGPVPHPSLTATERSV
jgi:pimeloyl-ACP methyl ester carboxylesterase